MPGLAVVRMVILGWSGCHLTGKNRKKLGRGEERLFLRGATESSNMRNQQKNRGVGRGVGQGVNTLEHETEKNRGGGGPRTSIPQWV